MPRRYEQRRRAEQQEETRGRIVDAAIELHCTIGPARTTMSAVAERAGVQRNTLYRHFPDERALSWACSGTHVARHPLPSPDGWRAVDDPLARAEHGLAELYGWFERNEAMLSNVLRDAEVDPVIREVSTLRMGEPLGALRSALLDGWPRARGRRRARLEALLDVAMSFHAWQSLVRRSGLSSAEAAELMARTLACAAADRA